MNLKHAKLVKEDADAWHVQGKDGKAFRVAKKGLSATTHGRIAQHFAEGGEAQEIDYSNSSWPASSDWSVGGALESMGIGAESPDEKRMRLSREAAARAPPGDASLSPGRQFLGAAATIPLASDEGTGAQAREGVPDADEVAAAPAPSAAPGRPEGAPLTPAAPAAGLPSGTVPGLQKGLDEATRAQQAAEAAKAKNVAALAQEQADIQAKQAAELAALQKGWQQRFEANQARVEKAQQDIASGKIDPNHFWETRTTGQRVAGILGLVLGGFYSGYTGRENPAEKLLNQAIDRDIDAQKANLGKKQTELNFYMQQGHTIQEATQLAKADALQRTAAQLQLAATQHAGPEAMAAAQEASAKLSQQGLLLKQKAFEDGLGNQVRQVQLRQALEAQQQARQAAGVQGQVVEALRTGRGMTPQLEAQLPKELSQRVVHVAEERPVTREGRPVVDASGNPRTAHVATARLALDEEAAKKAREELKLNSGMDKKVRALEAFVREHPRGTLGAADNQRAAILLNDVKLEWAKAQEGLSRYTELESGTLDKMIADPGSIYGAATGKTGASLQYLRRAVNDTKAGILDAYTVPNG